jgi:hypothetical protein
VGGGGATEMKGRSDLWGGRWEEWNTFKESCIFLKKQKKVH